MRLIKKKCTYVDRAGITIIYDDREKQPWKLPYKMLRKRLDVGDYTVKGYEKVIALEKKENLSELYTNISIRSLPRFRKFLGKLAKYPVKCLIVNESLDNIDYAYRMLKKKVPNMQVKPSNLIFWISKISVYYGIPMLFTEDMNIVNECITEAVKKAKDIK